MPIPATPEGVGRRPWLSGPGCRIFRLTALLTFLLFVPAAATAMVYCSTGDPNFNTTEPGGVLAGSGWQWVGMWGGFQGTPIGPHHFIAAHHIGGSIGDPFVLNGATYKTTAFTDDTASDLRIWEVDGTFPVWASLYRGSNEVGQIFVVFGRGVPRGSEIRVANALKGWTWGIGDGRLRWGQNAFVSVRHKKDGWGDVLYARFSQGSGINGADLSSGDSSGPVFINDGTGWKLAGIAATVDAYFNTTDSGPGFIASLFDARGLFYSSTPPTGWKLITGAAPVPSGFCCTRVSVRAAWIDSVIRPGADRFRAGSIPTK